MFVGVWMIQVHLSIIERKLKAIKSFVPALVSLCLQLKASVHVSYSNLHK